MIPTNETGALIIFAQKAASAGWEIISAQTAFPDLIVRRNGQRYRAEMEYDAANFLIHGHDIIGCDLIICWKNSLSDDFILPIIELSRPGWENVKVSIIPDLLKERFKIALDTPKPRELKEAPKRQPKRFYSYVSKARARPETNTLKAVPVPSNGHTPPDVLHYSRSQKADLQCCPVCARRRRANGQELIVWDWVNDVCQDCGSG